MAFSSATVSTGSVTRKADYDRLKDNTIYNRDIAGYLPVGAVVPWTTNTAPAGYEICNGGELNRVTFSDLFNVIGTDYGVGDGSTTFNKPDYRGVFLRGSGDHGSMVKSDGSAFGGGAVGDENDDKFQGHRVANRTPVEPGSLGPSGSINQNRTTTDPDPAGLIQSYSEEFISDGVNGTPRTGDETNPANIAVTWIIRATNTSVTLEDVTSSTIADLIVTNSADIQGPLTVSGSHVDLLGTDYTVLADYPTRKYNGIITLSEALTNFEYLVIKGQYYTATNAKNFSYIPTALIDVGDLLHLWNLTTNYAQWYYTNSTTLTFLAENSSWIRTVYGMGRKA